MDFFAQFPFPSTSATTAPNKQTPEKVAFLCVEGTKHKLQKGLHKIGRRCRTSNIVLPFQSVSRDHCLIRVINSERNLIIDRKPKNPTILNGEILQRYKLYPLKNGDKLRFGEVFAEFKLLEERNMPHENNVASTSMMPCITLTDTDDESSDVISPILPGIFKRVTPGESNVVKSPILPSIGNCATPGKKNHVISPMWPQIIISDTADDSYEVISPIVPQIIIPDTPDESDDVISPPSPRILAHETPEEINDGFVTKLPAINCYIPETPESSSDEFDNDLPSPGMGY